MTSQLNYRIIHANKRIRLLLHIWKKWLQQTPQCRSIRKDLIISSLQLDKPLR